MKRIICIILLFLFLTANVGQAQFNDSEPMFGQMLNLGHWPTDGLVFYWRGIEAGDVVDESFYGNHGTLINSPTWVGDGLHFTRASDQRVDIDSSPIVTAAPLTFVCWFKVDVLPSVAGESYYLLDIGTISDTASLQLSIQTDNKVDFVATQAGAAAVSSQDTISVNTWHMAVGVANSPTSRFVFLDGRKSAENTTSKVPVALTRFSIGARKQAGTFDHYLDGVIAITMIYNRALSDSEILDLLINPDLPMQQEPIWLLYSPAAPSGIVPIIQAHTRRRRAG